VNFQKYHQSYDHLKSSSVYRMIHETEKRQPGAFEGRPVKIPALEDYKQLLQACCCNWKNSVPYTYYINVILIITDIFALSFQNAKPDEA